MGKSLLGNVRPSLLKADAKAVHHRYAVDKLTELVSATLEAGADAGTLASLQVPFVLSARLARTCALDTIPCAGSSGAS